MVYYVKAGQPGSEQIVANSLLGNLPALYLEMLASLGWPVTVSSHPGWTGQLATSWKVSDINTEPSETTTQPGPARFNGDTSVLYWADVASELAVLVPSRLSGSEIDSRPSSAQGAAFLRGEEGRGSLRRDKVDQLSLELREGESQQKRKVGRSGGAEQRVVVAWLECMEDVEMFPLGSLVQRVNSVCLVIFLHPLSSGLIRVKLTGHSGKMNCATPLVDGMVVSRRSIGPLVRQTALNMCKRKRLEADTYQPPHVRRKIKIQEMVQKFRSHMTEPEFYAHLFNSPCI